MPERTHVVGLTGGIGTGKSRVAARLRELGAAVECSDEIVRALQAPGGRALAEIAATFGETYLSPDGALDRERLGALVFADPEARRKLNRIVHPLVYDELRRRLDGHIAAGCAVVVLDIPLLLEGRRAGQGSGANLPFDTIVVVYASPETQVQRVIARDHLSREAAESRVRAQISIDEKRAMADVVIENDGAWDVARAQVDALYATLADRADSAACR